FQLLEKRDPRAAPGGTRGRQQSSGAAADHSHFCAYLQLTGVAQGSHQIQRARLLRIERQMTGKTTQDIDTRTSGHAEAIQNFGPIDWRLSWRIHACGTSTVIFPVMIIDTRPGGSSGTGVGQARRLRGRLCYVQAELPRLKTS